MAPGASTLRLCLRTSLRHPSLPNVSIRPSRARAVNITASRKLSISAPRRALEDEDVGPTPQIHDIRRKFDRFRAERERDEKPLTQINQVQLDKLEQDMIEETRMWPIINYDPAKDPDREFTRRKFQKNLQEMGRKFTESELDAIMMGPLRATPTIKHKGRMPADALEPTETEGITPGKWEEDRDRFLPNPASLTYREIREVLSGVVDGDSNDWTKPEEPRLDRKSYWNDEDDDDPQTHDVDGWDTFDEDDILSVAHGKLDELREHRHYARLAAWELPLLSKLAKPFELPNQDQVLRFRYTTYMGEFHPAERKVVVTFSPADLGLTEAEQLKMKKLAGPRYDPEKDFIKMSCESFDHQAQNKRYLVDQVDRLIAAAKDPTDMFEDIPLDLRHHRIKKHPKFPKEWYMTEERRKQLVDLRIDARLKDGERREKGLLVDGKDVVQGYLGSLSAYEEEQYVPLMAKKYVRIRGGRMKST